VGAIVTLDLPAHAPALSLPWIITFGPLADDQTWEPVVVGPYERRHAMALAEDVVADEELMAVVEPLVPHISADQIRMDIATAIAAPDDEEAGGHPPLEEDGHRQAPSPEEIRAGFARIAAKLLEPTS
jgi:hypothetical protein